MGKEEYYDKAKITDEIKAILAPLSVRQIKDLVSGSIASASAINAETPDSLKEYRDIIDKDIKSRNLLRIQSDKDLRDLTDDEKQYLADNPILTKEEKHSLTKDIMKAARDIFQKEDDAAFADDSPFVTNINGHADVHTFSTRIQQFIQYLSILSLREKDVQEHYFESHPPKVAGDIACLGGTGTRQEQLLLSLNASLAEQTILHAHNVVAMEEVDKLKTIVATGNQVHIPPYLSYALGLHSKDAASGIDMFYLTPQGYITPSLMHDFQVNYADKFKNKLLKEIIEQIEDKSKDILSFIKEFKDINLISEGMSSDSEDEEISAFEKRANDFVAKSTALKEKYGLDVYSLTKEEGEGLDAITVWDEEKISSFITKTTLLEEIKKITPDKPVSEQEQDDIKALSDIKTLYSTEAYNHLKQLATSDNPEALSAVVNAIWVMGEAFDGKASLQFIDMVKGVDIDSIKKKLHQTDIFKIGRIKDRHEAYLRDEKFREYSQGEEHIFTLSELIEHGAPIENINSLIEKLEKEALSLALAELTNDGYKTVIANPYVTEIFDKLKEKGVILGNETLRELIYKATEKNQVDLVKSLSKYITQENCQEILGQTSNGGLVINFAARDGNLELVRLFIENGANVNQANKDGATPLHIAAQKGHKDVAKLLLENGAEVNQAAKDGATPLCIAAFNGHKDVAKLLLENGANINQAAKDGATPLYIAAQNGHKDVVEILLAKDANINQAKTNGATPLYIAAQNGHKDVAKLLLEKGAEVNQADKYEWTPLCIAAFNGHKDVVEILLEKDANINQANTNGATPLYIAAQEGHKDAVKLLLEKDANINQAAKDGATPLFIAAFNGHKDVVEILLEKGAEVNKAYKDGWTPLHIAAQKGHKDVAKLLLENGAEVNQAAKDGATPLCIAAQEGKTEVVKLLLKAEAKISRLDKFDLALSTLPVLSLFSNRIHPDVKEIEINFQHFQNAAEAIRKAVKRQLPVLTNPDELKQLTPKIRNALLDTYDFKIEELMKDLAVERPADFKGKHIMRTNEKVTALAEKIAKHITGNDTQNLKDVKSFPDGVLASEGMQDMLDMLLNRESLLARDARGEGRDSVV